MRKSPNNCTNVESGQLYHYLKVNRASLKRNNLTYPQAAVRIAKKLGFRVTVDNIKGLIRKDNSLAWSLRQLGQMNKTKTVQPTDNTHRELMQLRQLVTMLEQRLNEEIAVVGKVHIRLANTLGVEYENAILTRLERRSPAVLGRVVK